MAKKKAKKKPEPELETCPYCEAVMAIDEKPLLCPRCNRRGCDECMPLGRGCMCPECEEGVY